MNGSGRVDILSDHVVRHLYIGGTATILSKRLMALCGPFQPNITFLRTSVSANMYFLTGNDIPGPPPLNAQLCVFGVSQKQTRKNEREIVWNWFCLWSVKLSSTSAVKEECKYVTYSFLPVLT
ncbi:MAG: hypothetical protein IPL23_08095 [Saprospiraceae bacterium]|nr:hypothetical protein [Saprospiraceae bacterium]